MTGDLAQSFPATISTPRGVILGVRGRPTKPVANPANRIQEVRNLKGKSRADLARAANVSTETIRKYEADLNDPERAEPPLNRLERIAEVLGVKTYELLNDYDPGAGEEERALLAMFRRLNHAQRLEALSFLGWLATRAESA